MRKGNKGRPAVRARYQLGIDWARVLRRRWQAFQKGYEGSLHSRAQAWVCHYDDRVAAGDLTGQPMDHPLVVRTLAQCSRHTAGRHRPATRTHTLRTPQGECYVYIVPEGEEQLAVDTLMRQVSMGKIDSVAAVLMFAGILGEV